MRVKLQRLLRQNFAFHDITIFAGSVTSAITMNAIVDEEGCVKSILVVNNLCFCILSQRLRLSRLLRVMGNLRISMCLLSHDLIVAKSKSPVKANSTKINVFDRYSMQLS